VLVCMLVVSVSISVIGSLVSSSSSSSAYGGDEENSYSASTPNQHHLVPLTPTSCCPMQGIAFNSPLAINLKTGSKTVQRTGMSNQLA